MPARHNGPITQNQIERLKQRAKALKNEKGITQSQALDNMARDAGFSSWKALINEAELTDESNDEDEDAKALDSEREVKPIFSETLEVKNRTYLAKLGIEYAIFIPTPTGFIKSILDATAQMRSLFELSQFHFYSTQLQGPENKVEKTAVLLCPASGANVSKVSLYRPKTKNGDPRMWFRGLSTLASPGEEVAVIIDNDQAYLINISNFDIAQNDTQTNSVGAFLRNYVRSSDQIANELLLKLKELAKRPIVAIGKGDTAIGMAIENALGIPPNSSKTPDYKGIEIKSSRGRKTRNTLFAQVPIWDLSGCKSSGEILEKYGYMRGTRKKLYCTVSTKAINSQGLHFNYNSKNDDLHEIDANRNSIALWTGNQLRGRLKEKHSETFWIKATSEVIDGIEYFHLKSVEHTKSPLLAQLMPQIESGVVTMDHLISRDDAHGVGVREKGPLFKINPHHLNLLFPEPTTYILC
jgi:hypothetical protein